MDPKVAVSKAREKATVIPAYNVPYLPMVEPIIKAIVDKNSVGMIQVARVEWEKFESESLEAVAKEYNKYKNDDHTMLHLDHVPVIDEDYKKVDYIPIIKRAIDAGYQSCMVDASRLDLEDNITATKKVVDLAHAAGIPCEAELGAVMGHESGPQTPYEEIFRTKKGFTKIDEAERFAKETDCDWLSVAVGNIHGAVAEKYKYQKKPEARLDVKHVSDLYAATNIPLVLHGGSGIQQQYILDSFKHGIAKMNIGTEIRQAYLIEMRDNGDLEKAREAVYNAVCDLIENKLHIKDSKTLLFG